MKERHVFAICAYKESEYLEKCILSLKNQTLPTPIIICTSTPNDYIRGLAEKYEIPLYVREGKSDIRDDWNFAYNTADASYVTVAHQDDVYNKHFARALIRKVDTFHQRFPETAKDRSKDFSMHFTDYRPLKNESTEKLDINCRIRKFLRGPMKSMHLGQKKWARRMILSMGNSIVCPSVTYNKDKLGDSIFTSELKFNIDWDTFLKLAKVPGAFLYTDRPLTYYRVHDGATSKAFIVNNGRVIEDTAMFCKFWPKFMAKFIMIFYKFAYRTYDN